jgi:hypothetical protein
VYKLSQVCTIISIIAEMKSGLESKLTVLLAELSYQAAATPTGSDKRVAEEMSLSESEVSGRPYLVELV